MNFRWAFSAVLLFLSVGAHSAEFQKGWNSQSFYEAVNHCRSSIVYPAIQDYAGKALENGSSEVEALEDGMKSMPVFDEIATPGCFCVINEIAQDHPADAYPENVDFEAYMQVPRCTSVLKEKMIWFQNNRDEAKAMRLR